MFPLIMGKEMAHKVLGEGKLLTADEALKYGLVQHVYPPSEVKAEAEKYCLELARLPFGSHELQRKIQSGNLVEILKKVNKEECDECEKKWVCHKSFAAIAKYLESRNMNAAAFILRCSYIYPFIYTSCMYIINA